jgi:hypothetical protein
MARTRSKPDTWTMIGSFDGRPLAAKMRCTADESSACAPRP